MLTTQSFDEIAQVKKILQEDEERFGHFLGLLEKWMDCHTFLPKHYDKEMLPLFLRNCKYNLDKTKQKLELYFVYKKRYPELFCFHKFNSAEKSGLDNFYVFESSKLSPDGYRVGIGGFRSPDATGCDMNVVNKFMTMFGTYRSNRDVVNKGLIIVVNCQHLSPSILSGFFNTFYIRSLEILQKVYPFRIGGIYLTFVPKFAVPVANMIKMFFNEKIKKRVRRNKNTKLISSVNLQMFIEEGNEHMKKDIPMHCLPREFGGTDGTINENTAKCIQTLMQEKPWFLEHEKMQMVGDIPKDLYKISGIDDNFGRQGSFRKLNID